MSRVRIALAQCNLVVGDVVGNVARVLDSIADASNAQCDVVAFPELAITGYPPEDLLLKPSFVTDNLEGLTRVAEAAGETVVVVGFVDRNAAGDELYNAAAVCHRGEVVGIYRKRRLPNYAVFDEARYFNSGSDPFDVFEIAGVGVGFSICEDAWIADGPVLDLARAGADLIININASPFHAGKTEDRLDMLVARANEVGEPIAYVNLVGGQDELVFDGGSLVVGADGSVLARAHQFEEALLIADVEVSRRGHETSPDPSSMTLRCLTTESRVGDAPPTPQLPVATLDRVREVYEALVLGTRDYVRKNGFTDAVIGLSGGVDSSLVASIAVDALGADRVHGVLMPSRYSSEGSISDAEALARNLGIESRIIPIEDAQHALTTMLAPSFEGRPPDLTEENLQSRIRGVLLMALSNKFGWMVLTTGNKSESAVGYSTLYGDSAGGFAVIKDVPKLLVYELCHERNARAGGAGSWIPSAVLTKPPSAELRPDQRDDQSLPPYEVLDPIIEAYVERDRTVADLIEDGFDEAVVRRIARLIDLAEYKRRQFPPGVRVTTKAFGKDRRLPITNLYRS